MKVCVIGNSHVGALKLAWDTSRAALHAFELTFFAQRGWKIMKLLSQGNRLVPSSEWQRAQLEFTSAGLADIDTAAYDLFLVYGLYEHPPLVKGGRWYSEGVREAAIIDRATRQRCYQMVQRIRDITWKPIVVGFSPLPANPTCTPLSAPLLPYVEEIDLINRKVFGPLEARVIPQPSETIVNERATAFEYSVGSYRLDIGGGQEAHPDRDDAHMNEAYGQVWLMNFQCWLASEAELVAQGLEKGSSDRASVAPVLTVEAVSSGWCEP